MLWQMATMMRPLSSRMARHFGLIAVLLIRAAGPYVLFARDLDFVVDVVEGVKDLVAALEIFNGPVGQHLAHAVHKVLPILRAVEIVDHEEAAFEQVLAQPFGFGIVEGPGLHLNGVDPRVVEYFVGVERDDLLGGAAVDAGETVHGDEELSSRPWDSRATRTDRTSTTTCVGANAGHVGVVGQAVTSRTLP